MLAGSSRDRDDVPVVMLREDAAAPLLKPPLLGHQAAPASPAPVATAAHPGTPIGAALLRVVVRRRDHHAGDVAILVEGE
jgi:hypothetical protein